MSGTYDGDFGAFRSTIEDVLYYEEHEPKREWTVQGFGMLRCYFGASDRYRLNIWNPALAVPHVSLVHDHPWDFRSWVFAGVLYNRRFEISTPLPTGEGHQVAPVEQGLSGLYDFTNIKTGPNGGPTADEIKTVFLRARPEEWYSPGDTYRQAAKEIHMTYFQPGTVTLNDRTNRAGENARVFWQHATPWVDAKPRRASNEEVRRTLALALSRFAKSTARAA